MSWLLWTKYNYFRDFDPALGRYVESDPIGLSGGINTYGYVGGKPLLYSDPSGLVPNPAEAACVMGPNPVCVGGVAVDIVTWVVAPAAVAGAAAYATSDSSPLAVAQGNVADSEIEKDYGREASECKLGGKKPEDKCEWLERNAGRYSAERVKRTQKAWGCRGSRHGKGGKGR